MNRPDEEQIRMRAYELWREAGCPEGGSEGHWFQAEAELAGQADGQLEGQTESPVPGESFPRNDAIDTPDRDTTSDTPTEEAPETGPAILVAGPKPRAQRGHA